MNQENDQHAGAEFELAGGTKLRVTPLTGGMIRFSAVRTRSSGEPLLNRYHFLKEDWPALNWKQELRDNQAVLKIGNMTLNIDLQSGAIQVSGSQTLTIRPDFREPGFSMTIGLDAKERLFGLGDENREGIMKRGRKATIWAQNVKSYIPVPFLLSSRGWALLINTTFRHEFDLGKTESDKLVISAAEGPFDFYLFFAGSMPGLIDLYTQLSGRPVMLPKYAFGYMFICNEENNARAMLDDARNFRLSGIPCDSIGLEPDWMEKHYDFSVDKKWHPTKFYIPYWIRDMRPHHPITFFGALHRLGFRLSLWLCCDYDLLWEEEKRAAATRKTEWDEDSAIADTHFESAIRLDRQTVAGQSWFEHLKQFVHQGVSAFKLDGANFIMEHPDRLWADQYKDSEVHNLLPLVYGRQMSRGYADYTGERAMINIPMGYAGIQHYCATWAGDTGGGAKPLVSMLNLGFCGISSTSCDIEVTNIQSIHFGFLQAWPQQNNGNYWQQPWFMGQELEEAVRFYSRLRSRLFPYLYSFAHVAAKTGLPLMRALALVWPDTDAYDDVINQYMLGDALLVSAFSDQIVLPEGEWFDFWTEEKLSGSRSMPYHPPVGRGGGLFVRAGSVIPMQDWAPSLEQSHPDCLDLHVYPGGSCRMDLFEDDGKTYRYQNGEIAVTPIELDLTDDAKHKLTLGRRTGSYEGMEPATGFKVIIHTAAQPFVEGPSGSVPVSADGENRWSFAVPAGLHAECDLIYIWS